MRFNLVKPSSTWKNETRRTKSIFGHQKVAQGVVQVNHVPGSNQIADVFTKPMTENSFVPIQRKLGVCSLSKALTEGSCPTSHLSYFDSLHYISQNDVSTQVSTQLSQLVSLTIDTNYLFTNDYFTTNDSFVWIDG